MSRSDPPVIDLAQWVEDARRDPVTYLERQATEVLLNAIGMTHPYGNQIYLKGGVLMGIVYRSPRQTVDVDFTIDLPAEEDLPEDLQEVLDRAMARAAAHLGHPDLLCKVQTLQRQPRKDRFEDADFPALIMKVGCARRGSHQEGRLEAGESAHAIKVDINFNEPVHMVKIVQLGEDGPELATYSFADLVAEKLRSLLQQPIRNRNRRQDIFDLARLLEHHSPGPNSQHQILEAFLKKSRSRGIKPGPDSLSDPEIKERAQADWETLELEIDDLPDFDTCFARVETFYRNLPWGSC